MCLWERQLWLKFYRMGHSHLFHILRLNLLFKTLNSWILQICWEYITEKKNANVKNEKSRNFITCNKHKITQTLSLKPTKTVFGVLNNVWKSSPAVLLLLSINSICLFNHIPMPTWNILKHSVSKKYSTYMASLTCIHVG